MDTVGRVTKAPDRIIERHLLGLGVLVVTVSAGYFFSGLSGGRQAHPAVQEARVEVEEDNNPVVAEADDAELTIDEHIKEVAARHGVRADLVAAVIEAESDFNPRAVSRRGARGLMQLMPKTAKRLGVADPFDPKENIEGGVKHLRAMMDRFDNNIPLALAAYNAGEVAVIKYRGVPPYRETRAYVKRIMKRLDRSTARL
ncbi:MAG TPA: lytic transglycosylase domain-containing protein [Methylomirabilota bacterium]|nr:lytic transglycosylase domain-containing protein [Methylomirabilota bacterium]